MAAAAGLRRGFGEAASAWLAAAPTSRFRAVLLGLYALHLATGLAAHAMWLDEAQAWLIVRDSSTLSELVGRLAYEGHPLGWYLLLWPLKALGRQPEWMQMAQAACAMAAAALLVWRGPFGRLELVLILLSYPFLFEYAVKSRSYALGCAVLFLFCEAFSHRRPPLLLAAAVALLWNVHALFGLASLGCIAAVLAQRTVEHGWRGALRPSDAVPMAIIVLGIAAAVAVARPPPDSGFAVGWTLDLRWDHVKSTALTFGALVFGQDAPGRLGLAAAAVGIAVVLAALARWRRAPAAAAFLAVALGATLAFMHVKWGTFPWHRSIAFVILVAAVWLSREAAGPAGPALLPRWLFVLLLACQAAEGVRMATLDRAQPYSAGRDVAKALREAGLDGAPLFALRDIETAAVGAYLGSAGIFYGPGERDGTFIHWDRKRLAPVDERTIVDRAAGRPGSLLLDCRERMPEGAPPDPRLVEWKRFPGRMENCVVYRVTAP